MPRKSPAPPPKSPSGVYLIQDTRQYVGNAVLWWCPEGAGYTTDVDAAGRFDEAFVSRSDRSTDRAIPVEAAIAASSRVVNGDALHTALDALRVSS